MNRIALTDYADSFDSYAAAIEDARRKGHTVGHYASPIEPACDDATDEKIAEVGMDDISLIFVAIAT
jgi:hypothetical protein